ncbi:MAG: sigma-70 family RNA polymerase sigma factor [Acidobacteriota bacterium]
MSRDVTDLLIDWNQGDPRALEALTPIVYDELRALARRYMGQERRDHTLEPTALVHEAFLRLVDQKRVEWQNRAHFFAVAARLMRRVLLKHAGKRNAAKRGGGTVRIRLEDEGEPAAASPTFDVLALEDALNRLQQLDPRQVQIVELRLCGLTSEEAAEALGLSPSTVHRDWRLAKAWLTRELGAARTS